MRELALPLFDQDIEDAQGLPEGAKRLKALLRISDGLLIAAPEYNNHHRRAEERDRLGLPHGDGRRTAACRVSRENGGVDVGVAWRLGRLARLVTVRSILGNLGVLLLPDQVSIPTAHQAFDADGKLKEERKGRQVAALAQALVEFTQKVKSEPGLH